MFGQTQSEKVGRYAGSRRFKRDVVGGIEIKASGWSISGTFYLFFFSDAMLSSITFL